MRGAPGGERAPDLEVMVRIRIPGEAEPLCHYRANEAGRWACGKGAGGTVVLLTVSPDRVTCPGCRRTVVYREAVAVAAAVAAERERARAGVAAAARVRAYRWFCPLCDGEGDDGSGACLHCAGHGLVTDEQAAGWGPLREAPRPPGVRRTPCHDCALRPGSQERENGDDPPARDKPFFCHQNTPMVRGEYRPVLWAHGIPIGSQLCAAWWDIAVCGRPADLAPAVYPEVNAGGTRQ